MADIISIKDRLKTGRQSLATQVAQERAKGEVLLFTGIFYERFEPLSTWSRVELSTGMPSLPSPANPA
ncbi:hypothetical protein [Peteryoungia ipomoeae]|uniref:Uncharacterized protein n=1 Tax=Peteryoungia ipomoeae TaxID=1210932 RepID=A0A4S8NZ15_9HYPH|nr:hypothetical protein [Peteryoungia ipomoeae]THV22930.1 hypothetical protein FAA97_09835 [Peteryoungia ipomoeae]